jgi:hypothetical protein
MILTDVFNDLADETIKIKSKSDNALKSDHNAEQLQNVFDEAQKKIQNAVIKTQECNKRAECYIAISQYREENLKQKHIEKHGYFGTSDQSQKSTQSPRRKLNIKHTISLNDDLEVSYFHSTS